MVMLKHSLVFFLALLPVFICPMQNDDLQKLVVDLMELKLVKQSNGATPPMIKKTLDAISQRQPNIDCDCDHCIKDPDARAIKIRKNFNNYLKIIIDFNFDNSLGRTSLNHLISNLLALMQEEVDWPLSSKGIFKQQDIKGFEQYRKDKYSIASYAQLFLEVKMTDKPEGGPLLEKFKDAIYEISRKSFQIHDLASLHQKSASGIFRAIKLKIDENIHEALRDLNIPSRCSCCNPTDQHPR